MLALTSTLGILLYVRHSLILGINIQHSFKNISTSTQNELDDYFVFAFRLQDRMLMLAMDCFLVFVEEEENISKKQNTKIKMVCQFCSNYVQSK